MNQPDYDWNALWRKIHAENHRYHRDPGFWDRRAPEFARHASGSNYVDQFLAIMQPQPDWSVLDIGSAAGTLAVPLASAVRRVTALDASSRMIALLQERCRDQAIDNITAINGRWEDDWQALGIAPHDVAVASRSLIVADLREAILKLTCFARQRIYLSTLVDDGPHDRTIFQAVGRDFPRRADYIIVYNLLRQMGIYANVAFTVNEEEKSYAGVEEAVDDKRWMIRAMTPDEEEKLRAYLTRHLVRHNGRWKMPRRRIVRWAVLWWDTAAPQ